MSLDVLKIVDLPIVNETIGTAIRRGIEEGRELYKKHPHLTNRQIADKAITSAMTKTALAGAVTNIGGITTALTVGLTADLVSSMYWQVKLAATILTIYGVVDSEEHRFLVLAAAAGCGVGELANMIGTRVAQTAIKKALMNIPGKVFTQINKALGIKLITKAGTKSITNVTKLIPIIGGVTAAGVNAVTMKAVSETIVLFAETFVLTEET